MGPFSVFAVFVGVISCFDAHGKIGNFIIIIIIIIKWSLLLYRHAISDSATWSVYPNRNWKNSVGSKNGIWKYATAIFFDRHLSSDHRKSRNVSQVPDGSEAYTNKRRALWIQAGFVIDAGLRVSPIADAEVDVEIYVDDLS